MSTDFSNGVEAVVCKVPLVEKHSPIVIPLITYLHEHFNHKGVESTYKLSLEMVKVIESKPLFWSLL